jgi:hypothetical protein
MTLRRLLFASTLSLGVVVLFVVAVRFDPFGFERFRDGHAMPFGWKARVVDAGPEAVPRFRYSLVGPSGDVPLQQLDFDDLAFALVEHRDRTILLTRYPSSGSSEADYYSAYHLTARSIASLPATERWRWDTDEPDACLEAPVRRNDGIETVFGTCGLPKRRGNRLHFHMPGYRCSWTIPGGCPSETILDLEAVAPVGSTGP